MGHVISSMSADEKASRRRALVEGLMQSRRIERQVLARDRSKDTEQAERLAAEIGSVVRQR